MGLDRIEAAWPLGPGEPLKGKLVPRQATGSRRRVATDKSVRIGPIYSRSSILYHSTAHRRFPQGPSRGTLRVTSWSFF